MNHTDSFKVHIRLRYRSSHKRCSLKKDVLKNLAKVTEKRLYQSLSFNKVAGQEAKEISKLCILRERIKIWIFRIFSEIFEYMLNRYTAFLTHVDTRQLPSKCRGILSRSIITQTKKLPTSLLYGTQILYLNQTIFRWNIFLL